MEKNEMLYSKGFNNGYLLAKYENELLVKIIKGLNPIGEYLSGFFSGKNEYELEQSRIQLSEFDNLRNRNKDLGLDLEI